MGTFSQNTTIKIGTVLNTSNSFTGTYTYTVPAGSYLQVMYAYVSAISFGGSGSSCSMFLGSTQLHAASSGSLNTSCKLLPYSDPQNASSTENKIGVISSPLILGPGQTFVFNNSAFGGTYSLIGTLFSNTP